MAKLPDKLKKLLLSQRGLLDDFDSYRLIDPISGCVLTLTESELIPTEETFYSPAASFSKDAFSRVRLEAKDHAVCLILTIPVVIHGQHCIAELTREIESPANLAPDHRENLGTASLISHLNKQARTDPLTGIFNKRFILEHLPATIAACRINKQTMSLAMIDIDFFKRVNDVYGHMGADEVLVGLTERMSFYVKRQTDWLARYGGEEFLLCLPGAPAKACSEILEAMRQSINTQPFRCDGEMVSITVSIGIAQLTDEDDDQSLLRRADAKLYEAKHTGRNRICY